MAVSPARFSCVVRIGVVETYPLESPLLRKCDNGWSMFLRQNKRRKNGKTHRYFSVVENRRTFGGGISTQRQVLYLGEINDSQQDAWRRTLEVFDEDRQPVLRDEFVSRRPSAAAGGRWTPSP